MVVKYFLGAIVIIIVRFQYFAFKTVFLNNKNSRTLLPINEDENSMTLEWVRQHSGTRRNYPHHKLGNVSVDNITKSYNIEQIQLIIRHGTRYPVSSGMEIINDALKKLKESKNQDLTGWLKGYTNEYVPRRTGQLDSNGQFELYSIGRNLATRYPDFVKSLVDRDIVTDQFQAFSSWSSRTAQSGQAFSLGVFQGLGSLLGTTGVMTAPIFTYARDNDSIIAGQKSCPKWKKEAKDRVNVIMEPFYKKYLVPITDRLSKELGIRLTTRQVKGFYEACTAEVSNRHTIDTFCRLLTKEDILVMEYIEDVKHYYKYSYGLLDLNENVSCDLGKHISSSIEQKLNTTKAFDDNNGDESKEFKLNVKFGHSETLLPLQVLLGLHKNNELFTINMTDEQIINRQYKLSDFGYYASSLAFQLLSQKINGEKFIRVLENEEEIILPGCSDVLCPIKQFRNAMLQRTQCDFKDFCKI